ncbi:acyltransferase family protein [Microbacterium pseudoresistens]|uniref:acyltransferase family protein n=1 Tax=Microbacterium pseudoresistens TaxID=640634 RepID=UPI0015CED9D3
MTGDSGATGRIAGLDGLRGLAALIVVFYHCSLLARPFLDPEAWTVLTRTPMKLLLAGTESVLVFFVLSGLVVALPALREGFSWIRYYPARLLRLYLPVFGALLFAAALILLIPRDPATMPEGSWMRDAQATTITPGSLLSEASLLRASYDIDNVLWSLRWELFFSLLLPLFVWIALRSRHHSLVVAALAVAATITGRLVESDALVYLPVFLLGTVMAVNLDALRTYAARPAVRRVVPYAGVAAALLLIGTWLARWVLPDGSIGDRALWGSAGLAAAVLVAIAAVWAPAARMLETRPMLWLGRISFSLYLVHVPIIGTVGYLLGVEHWWLACLIAVPLSLLVAAVFYRSVELPSHRLSRAAGDLCRRLARRPAPTADGGAAAVATRSASR